MSYDSAPCVGPQLPATESTGLAQYFVVFYLQVGKLMMSLNIDPRQLPSGPAASQDWDRLFKQGTPTCASKATLLLACCILCPDAHGKSSVAYAADCFTYISTGKIAHTSPAQQTQMSYHNQTHMATH